MGRFAPYRQSPWKRECRRLPWSVLVFVSITCGLVSVEPLRSPCYSPWPRSTTKGLATTTQMPGDDCSMSSPRRLLPQRLQFELLAEAGRRFRRYLNTGGLLERSANADTPQVSSLIAPDDFLWARTNSSASELHGCRCRNTNDRRPESHHPELTISLSANPAARRQSSRGEAHEDPAVDSSATRRLWRTNQRKGFRSLESCGC